MKMMERQGDFVQVADLETGSLSETLCQTEALEHAIPPQDPRQIILRSERQTFRRLPHTQAIVFAVKTSMRTLVDLNDAELTAFQREMESWPDDFAEYKGRNCWGDCVNAYCARRLQPKGR